MEKESQGRIHSRHSLRQVCPLRTFLAQRNVLLQLYESFLYAGHLRWQWQVPHLLSGQFLHIIHRVKRENWGQLRLKCGQGSSYEMKMWISSSQYSAHLRYLQKYQKIQQGGNPEMQECGVLPVP